MLYKNDDSKRKIIFFANDLNVGGIEKSLVNLLDSLVDFFDITLVLEKDEGVFRRQISDKVHIVEYPVSNYKIVPIRKIINYKRRLSFLSKHKGKYDFSCAYATYLYSANVLAKKCSKNSCLFVHNDYSNIYDETSMREFFDSRGVEQYKKIIFVSNESRANFCKLYPNLKDNTIVINNLVNVDEIIEKSKEKCDVKKEKKDITFAFVGRLDEHQKQIGRLLETFKILHSKSSNVRLWIIGGGEEYDRAYKFIKDNKLESVIKLLGMQSNPYKYMALADYMIIVSDYEGFPVVFNEANILGKPMLSTLDITDDYYRLEDGHGFFIPKDPTECAKEISKIMKSDMKVKKEDYKELNRERVEKIKEVIENEV